MKAAAVTTLIIEETDAAEDPFLQERLKRGRLPSTQHFVARVDGAEAGLLIFEHWPTRSLGVVYEINVLARFRSNGVGNRLLAHAHTLALESGYQTLRLQARSLEQERMNDETLLSWYGRKGFVREPDDPGCMQKDLTGASPAPSPSAD